MKNKVKRIFAFALAAITVLAVCSLASCAKPPELSEIKPTIEVLIENSRKVNHILFGEGLPIAYYEDKKDAEGNPVPVDTEYENYYLVDPTAFYFGEGNANGFFMVEQIKADAEKVYSPDYIRPLYDMFFTGHYDADKGGVVRANYIDGENGILKLKESSSNSFNFSEAFFTLSFKSLSSYSLIGHLTNSIPNTLHCSFCPAWSIRLIL